MTIIIAIVGAVAGLAMVGRSVAERWAPKDSLEILLGLVALLTGLLHVTGNLQVKKFVDRNRTDSGTILGVFEIFLGAILLLSPYTPSEERPFLDLIAIGWALVGGIVIFFDALAMRREEKAAQNQLEESGAVRPDG